MDMIMGEKIKLPVDYTKLSPKIRKKVREKYCKLQEWNSYIIIYVYFDTIKITYE